MKTKITNKISAPIFAILALIIFGALSLKAAPGDLDATFGNGGIVTTPVTNFADRIRSIQVQPDGKIIVSGYSFENKIGGFGDSVAAGFIARYNSSGTLDASFGTNGKIITAVGSGNGIIGISMVLQPDGKIVAIGGGYSINDAGLPFSVFRYNSNGTLDASFGTGGSVITVFGGENEYPREVVLQPDGKIVVMGDVNVAGNADYFGLARYNPNGSLDNSFGTGGQVITVAGNVNNRAGSLLLQPDGKFVLAGSRGSLSGLSDIVLVRYHPNGSLDSGFGIDGKVFHSTADDNGVFDSVLQPDGKIVVSGYEYFTGELGTGSFIVRFNANGSFDTNFADNGIFSTFSDFFVGNSLALQPNGKIIGFGNGRLPSSPPFFGFAVVRVHPNGSPDTTFGTNGRRLTPIGSNENDGYAVALQPDGKIIGGGGGSNNFVDSDAAIVRYSGDSSVSRRSNFDFDGDGKADISVFRPSDRTWYLNQSTNGFSATQFGLSTDKITPADFDGDGKTDISVYRDGVWYWLASSNNYSFNARQFGIASDIPVPADYTGDGRADLAIYRNGTWWIQDLTNNQTQVVNFGISTDKPVAADYDGDGRADQAVYRGSGEWHLNRSTQGYTVINFGLATDKPVIGDYDGDGRTDQAVYQNGIWYLLQSTNGFATFPFGIASDIPAPADYDGDGRTDIAVYRNGTWYIWQSSNGSISYQQFGLASDIPIAGGNQ